MDFFTADLHLGHAGIMKYCRRTAFMTPDDRRGYEAWRAAGAKRSDKSFKPGAASVAAMDEALLANINQAVGPDDTLWILGDFAVGSGARDAESVRRYRETIRCRDVRLVWGNHDRRDYCAGLFQATYDATLIYIGAKGQPTITEHELWHDPRGRSLRMDQSWQRAARGLYLSHYAHAVWNKSHKGVWHLYGHSHGNFEAWREAHMPAALALDVGVDCWRYAPVGFEAINQLLRDKASRVGPHTIDHHGPDEP